ncbi:hypothetical protein H310_14203 [Aphanomyces invadans]|uniref:Auto-transporter adhesin head GIN domain-containing protein n=1 Tax=Aphanomyces invadans TaxID=157072 RepID=A0A024TCN0_9STRA|nr:hypothetical protein H310_14203 [Aphanomyces invadans]ETV91107.1 hypothetical protein H310_14203 [Aphanomyces invadans]|eukprot:XP_008880234.1 hypothetical protein H310_14203 [Aphanomyces invadans]
MLARKQAAQLLFVAATAVRLSAANVTSGDLVLRTGSGAAKTGNVQVSAGDATSRGDFAVTASNTRVEATDGLAAVHGPTVRVAAAQGSLNLLTETTGDVVIATGDNSGASSNVTIQAGTSSSSQAGSIELKGGRGVAGAVVLQGGDSSTANGGSVKITSGRGETASAVEVAVGGTVELAAGQGLSGAGGDVVINSGANGGAVRVHASDVLSAAASLVTVDGESLALDQAAVVLWTFMPVTELKVVLSSFRAVAEVMNRVGHFLSVLDKAMRPLVDMLTFFLALAIALKVVRFKSPL